MLRTHKSKYKKRSLTSNSSESRGQPGSSSTPPRCLTLPVQADNYLLAILQSLLFLLNPKTNLQILYIAQNQGHSTTSSSSSPSPLSSNPVPLESKLKIVVVLEVVERLEAVPSVRKD